MRTLCSRGAVALVVLLFAASGCGMLEAQYQPAELGEALKGKVQSQSGRYRIDAPEIPVLKKNIGIVRQDGLFFVIVGPDLKVELEKYEGQELELGVHMRRKPQNHMVVERIWAGGEEVAAFDSEKFRYRLPDLVSADEVPREKYDEDAHLCMIRPNADAKLASTLDHKIFACDFKVARHQVPKELARYDLAKKSGRALDKPQYFITSEGSEYLVTSPDPMTFLMLEYLLTEKREFRGGVVVQGLFDHGDRVKTGVAGTAEVHWVALGGPLYFRTPAAAPAA